MSGTHNEPNPQTVVCQCQPASNKASNFVDGSGQIFSMYYEMATEEDKKMVEDWKADAEGILVFTGLFSAAVASLISISIQDLQQNPQDTSNFYLANIYQATINPNGPNDSTSLPSSPPPFSPPNSAVWVNALWFLSLVISLTCALLATLLQQWARRYLKLTQSRYTPDKRARIRAFFSEGVGKSLLPWAVDALPTLLHISLFLFFAGLVVFLCNVDLTIFGLVLLWVGLCAVLYGYITCMPILHHDSPFYTPLSLPAWHIVTRMLFSYYRFLRWFNWSVRYRHSVYDRFRDLENSCRKSLMRGMRKTAEETALKSPSELVTRAFMWTFDCLDEDHELESFFSGLPGFRSSKVVDEPLSRLTEEENWKLYRALRGLLDRTLSSDLLPPPVKKQRAMICAKAADLEHTPHAWIIHAILFKYLHSGPVSTAIANILREWGIGSNDMDGDENTGYEIKALLRISMIIIERQSYDDSWCIFASNILGIPEASLRDYAAHGDDLSLVILIHFVRLQFTHFWKSYWREDYFSPVLVIASYFDVKDTSPELQHKFCALWNQIVYKAQDGNDREMASYILRRICIIYRALHQDTDSAPTRFSASTVDSDILGDPSSYPVCYVRDHSDSRPIHDDVGSTTPARAILHDPNVPAFVPSLTSPDQPSSSTHAPLPVDESPTHALPLDNQISDPVSAQAVDQTTTEGRCIPTTSLSPVTTDPSRTTQSSVSSPSPKSNASASPPAGIAAGRTAFSRNSLPGDLNVLSSPSLPVLDVALPTESHSFIRATAAEGESSTRASLSPEEEASYSTLGIREETTPTLNTSPPPVTDVATGGPSTRSPGTEHIEHRRTEAFAVEHAAVGRTPLSDVEALSSTSRTPVLDDFIPTESNSQILTPAASGLSRSWDASAVVEGEESAKGTFCQETVKGEPHDDMMVTSDTPTRLLAPRPIIDVVIAGPSSPSSLDTGIYPSHLHDQYDIV